MPFQVQVVPTCRVGSPRVTGADWAAQAELTVSGRVGAASLWAQGNTGCEEVIQNRWRVTH